MNIRMQKVKLKNIQKKVAKIVYTYEVTPDCGCVSVDAILSFIDNILEEKIKDGRRFRRFGPIYYILAQKWFYEGELKSGIGFISFGRGKK